MPKIKTKKPENNTPVETEKKGPKVKGKKPLETLADLLSGATPVTTPDGKKSRTQSGAKRPEQEGGKKEKKESPEKEEGFREVEAPMGVEIEETSEETEGGMGEGGENDIPQGDPKEAPFHVPPSDGSFPGEVVGTASENTVSPPEPQTVSVSVESTAPVPILSGASPSPRIQKELDKRKSLPVLGCSSCSIGQSCPQYAEGYVCAFNDAFFALPSRDVESVLENMRGIVNDNMGRYQRAKFAEQQSNGGTLDMNVTRQSQVVMDQQMLLLNLQREQSRVTVSVSGPNVAKEQGPGILAKLLMSKVKSGSSAPVPPPTSESSQPLELNVSQTPKNEGAIPSDSQGNPLPALSERAMAELRALEAEPPLDPVLPPPGGQAGPSLLLPCVEADTFLGNLAASERGVPGGGRGEIAVYPVGG